MNRHRRNSKRFTRQLTIPGTVPTHTPTLRPLIYSDLTYRQLRRECSARSVTYWNLTKTQMIAALTDTDTRTLDSGVLV